MIDWVAASLLLGLHWPALFLLAGLFHQGTHSRELGHALLGWCWALGMGWLCGVTLLAIMHFFPSKWWVWLMAAPLWMGMRTLFKLWASILEPKTVDSAELHPSQHWQSTLQRTPPPLIARLFPARFGKRLRMARALMPRPNWLLLAYPAVLVPRPDIAPEKTLAAFILIFAGLPLLAVMVARWRWLHHRLQFASPVIMSALLLGGGACWLMEYGTMAPGVIIGGTIALIAMLILVN